MCHFLFLQPELYSKELQKQTSTDSSENAEAMQYCGKLHFSLRYDFELDALIIKVRVRPSPSSPSNFVAFYTVNSSYNAIVYSCVGVRTRTYNMYNCTCSMLVVSCSGIRSIKKNRLVFIIKLENDDGDDDGDDDVVGTRST